MDVDDRKRAWPPMRMTRVFLASSRSAGRAPTTAHAPLPRPRLFRPRADPPADPAGLDGDRHHALGGKADRLRADGVEPLIWPGQPLAPALARATHLLTSIAPDPSGDPVLAAGMGTRSPPPALDWVGYLSTTGVYGDHAGDWIDEARRSPPRPSAAARGCWPKPVARRPPRRAHLPPRRHLRPRPRPVREGAPGHRAPHRQARSGVQPHPCRRHRAGAHGLHRPARARHRLQRLRRRPRPAAGRDRPCRAPAGPAAPARGRVRRRRPLAHGAQLLFGIEARAERPHPARSGCGPALPDLPRGAGGDLRLDVGGVQARPRRTCRPGWPGR
jgi:hypothetical protein